MRKLASVIALALGGVAGQALAADSYPDLRGTWIGTAEAVVAGATNHFPAAGSAAATEPQFRSLPGQLVVDRQDGRRFSGRMGSDESSERVIGVIAGDGTLFWVDEDGFNQARLIAPDTIENCYLQATETAQVAACIVMQRER